MAQLAPNKKSMSLTVKTVFDPKSRRFILLQDDKDLAGEPFRVSVNEGTATHATILRLAREKGLMYSTPRLPDYAAYPSTQHTDRLSVPVGVGSDSSVVSVSLKEHMVISGSTGSGKTVLLNSILYGVDKLGWNSHMLDQYGGLKLDSPRARKYTYAETFFPQVLESVSRNPNGRHLIAVDYTLLDPKAFLEFVYMANAASYVRFIVEVQDRFSFPDLRCTEIVLLKKYGSGPLGRARSSEVLVNGQLTLESVDFQCYASPV